MFFLEKAKTLTLFFLTPYELSVKRIHGLLLLVSFLILLSLNFAGGYREVEIPSPIPNLEVKHFIADNTAGSPGGNVGRCQLLSFFQSFFLFELLYLVLLEESFFFTHFLFIYSLLHFIS